MSKEYLLSLPERVIRSVVGLGAGLVREVGDVVIPTAVRRTQLYQNLVDTTLRFLIEQVGGVEGAYSAGEKLADDFLVRRTAGNVLELMGIVAFRASPVWVLASLADVAGAGRSLIPEIADELKAQGLLETEAEFTTVEQMLDGLERTSSRLANAVNTPPLDVASLRKEWAALRADAASLAPASLPSRDAIKDVWNQLKSESAAQKRSVFEMSSGPRPHSGREDTRNRALVVDVGQSGGQSNRADPRRLAARLLSRDARRHSHDRICCLCVAAAEAVSASGGRPVLSRAAHHHAANYRQVA